MNYEEMSDQEINFEVFHKSASGYWDRELSAKVWGLLADKHDYCNNASDAWPIIETVWGELSSVVMFDDKIGFGERQMPMWEAQSAMMSCGKLRAAMVVFLKLKEGNINGNN